jgi:hypothetical protein
MFSNFSRHFGARTFCVGDEEDMVMRRVAGLYLAVVFVLLIPTLAMADLFGLGMPWGSWGQTSSGCGGCCDPGAYYGAWGKCCPAVYVGYEIQQGRSRKPLSSGLDFTGNALLSQDLFQQVNTHFSDPGGLWLGVSNYCQCSDRVGIMVSGWYLFPSGGDAKEAYLLQPDDDTTRIARTWSTTRSWGWIDGAFVLGSPCVLNLIAGFRWDSFRINLKNPSTGPNFPFGTASDEADLTLNSYIPLIGTQCCYGGPCCGLLFRIVGFPWVMGNLTYGETGLIGRDTRFQADGNYNSARFLEVFSEYSRTCPGFGCLGIFARWNYLDCRSDTNQQFSGALGPIRTSWTIGGRVALNFDTPFWPF